MKMTTEVPPGIATPDRLQTRLGSLELKIPKLRVGSYLPSFLEPRKASEQALVAVVQEAYLKGVSTRKVADLVQALGMTGISKSQVSRLCGELDERVQAFLGRPLEGDWPYLWLDATYLKARDAGRVASKAAVIAVGVNGEGRREVLGLAVGPAETEAFWTEFLRGLTRRGLSGVQLVISDAQGPEGRGCQGAQRRLAALPGALHPQRAGARAAASAPDGGGSDPHCVRAGEPSPGQGTVA
jgi:transposase-like protein